MVRVVVTGGNGLVGHEVIHQLAEQGDEVICLGRKPPETFNETVRFVEADLGQALECSSLPDRVDAVIHLAQSARFNEFPAGARDMFAVNIAAPISLLDWARQAGVRSFVHASSGGLYGNGAEPFKETAPLQIPKRLAFYLSTKHAIEQLAAAYGEHFSVVALRYFFVYGDRQRRTMLMPRLVTNVREGNVITLQGADGMRINPVHVRDAAAAAIAAAKKEVAGVINVAGPDVVSLRQIAETIGEHIGRSPVFQSIEGAPGHLIADTEQMRQRLCIQTVSVSAGLESLCKA